ncbi:MAG: Ig-like domain-containing protein [Clostridiaceae bacterium]
MGKFYMSKQFSIVGILVLSLTLGGCVVKDKQTIIQNDVKEEVKTEEVEIDNNIQTGNSYLDEGKFEDAKKSYEKAISLEPSNKDTYLKIKDKYIEKGRLDDAYYIIKLAIDNNGESDQLKGVLEEIKNKFEVIIIEKTLYQNNTYYLPSDITFKLNSSEEIKASIKWNQWNLDTSKAGTYTFEGVIDQYGRKVKFTLNVLANVQEKKIGYLRQVLDSNGKRYLVMDEVEFYRGDKALEEAKKDGKAGKDEKGKYFVTNGYYIRNNNSMLKKYEISSEVSLGLLDFYFNPSGNSSDIKKVTYEEFRDYVNNSNSKGDGRLLCWFYIQNDIVTKVESQFVP